METNMNPKKTSHASHPSTHQTYKVMPAVQVEVIFETKKVEKPVFIKIRMCLCGQKYLLGPACPSCHLSFRM